MPRSKGNLKEVQTKELKNGRLAMVAFMAFTIQAQATGKGPLANLADHLSSPFSERASEQYAVFVCLRVSRVLAPPFSPRPADAPPLLPPLTPRPTAGNNIGTNIGHCMVPSSVDVQGITIPLTCLWPGAH